MATWKKVIVSGSAANLASLQVDNLASGSVVIGGGSGNLSTTAINGTGNIVATSNASGLTHSGSFSGSFIGSGAGLSGVAASFPVTEKTNLVTADKFFIQNSVGTTSEFVTYGNLLTDLAGTNLAVESSDSLTLAATITGITSISSTSFTGSLLGTAATASYILQAVSASFATNATSASFASQAANATTASYVLQAVSASFATLAQTANTASYVLQAVSASFATNAANASTASFVTTAQTASFVATASFANNANLLDGLDSTVFATTGSNTFRANQIISGTLDVIPAGSATAELAVTSTGVKIGNIVSDIHTITGSVSISGSITGSLLGTASFATLAQTANTASFVAAANVVGTVTSASYALTASFAQNGGTLNNALTFGVGLSGSASTFNGSAAVTVAISGSAALSTNLIPKWSGTGLQNSNITDNGTQVQVGSGASSGLSVAAGGVNVTGNSQFNNNVTIAGDLAVNGTTTFINTTNTYVKDQFVLIASGSTSLVDAGIVAQYNAAGSGSTFYLDAAPGTYGRWAVAYDVIGTSTAVTADEYVVTAKISANSVPSAAPTWGGAGNGSGNIWIKNDTGDIYIYA